MILSPCFEGAQHDLRKPLHVRDLPQCDLVTGQAKDDLKEAGLSEIYLVFACCS